MSFGQQDYILLSRPHRVVWAGFESNTYRLQQAGWEFSAEQNLARYSLQVAMKHAELGLYGISHQIGGMDYFGRGRYTEHSMTEREMTIEIACIRGDFYFRHFTMPMVDIPDWGNMKPVDMQPQYVTEQSMKDIEERHHIFAGSKVRTQEIIVSPQSVAECLDHIKRLQDPDMAAIRQRNRERLRDQGHDHTVPSERQIVHAQLISLAA